MPHYKDGQEAKRYDLVKFQSGARYEKDKDPQPIYSEGRVVEIHPGDPGVVSCCELTLLVGSAKLLGTVNLPQFAGDEHPPRAGVILDGYYTSATAKDCELVGFNAAAPAADHPAAADQA